MNRDRDELVRTYVVLGRKDRTSAIGLAHSPNMPTVPEYNIGRQ